MKLYVGVTDNIMNTMLYNRLGNYQGILPRKQLPRHAVLVQKTVFLEINGVPTTPMFTAFSR